MVAHMPVITHKDFIQYCFHLPYWPQACDSIILNYWPHLLYSKKVSTMIEQNSWNQEG